MAQARVLARMIADPSVESLRAGVVLVCALALIAAGQPLPF